MILIMSITLFFPETKSGKFQKAYLLAFAKKNTADQYYLNSSQALDVEKLSRNIQESEASKQTNNYQR